MNIFILFFMTTAVVTAAPHAAAPGKHQQKSGKQESHCKSPEDLVLKEVIHNVNQLKSNLSKKTMQKKVQNPFMYQECNNETLCQAAKVLSAFTASDLELKNERDWRLPRRLRAYSGNCTDPYKLDEVSLRQLLDAIHNCTQKEYARPC